MDTSAARSPLDEARDLVRRAWRLRYTTMTSPPADRTELDEAVGRVRRYLSEAVSLCRASGADGVLAEALGKLGHVEEDAGRGEAALACYEEAVQAARRADRPLLLAHAVRHLGDAKALWRRARTLYGSVGVEAGVDECTEHLARLG